MKKITTLKFLFPFLFCVFCLVGKVSAQLPSLTITITDASNCSSPCDGTAAANNVPGATYVWNTSPVQTTPTATGLCPGTYSCTASYLTFTTGGAGTVGCASAVNNISIDENISLFPNPAHNELYIQINTALQGKIDFTVRNILGTVVYQESIETNGYLYKWIDISALPTGVYDVEFLHGTSVTRNKFIKE